MCFDAPRHPAFPTAEKPKSGKVVVSSNDGEICCTVILVISELGGTRKCGSMASPERHPPEYTPGEVIHGRSTEMISIIVTYLLAYPSRRWENAKLLGRGEEGRRGETEQLSNCATAIDSWQTDQGYQGVGGWVGGWGRLCKVVYHGKYM